MLATESMKIAVANVRKFLRGSITRKHSPELPNSTRLTAQFIAARLTANE